MVDMERNFNDVVSDRPCVSTNTISLTDHGWTTVVAIGAALAWIGCDGTDQVFDPEVTVEANEANTLSFFVSWTTDVPATSRVEFGEDGEPEFFVQDEALVTDHQLLVFGMHANTPYDLWIRSFDEEGEEIVSEQRSVETAALPFDDLVLELTVRDEARVQPGWTLTNILVGEALYPATAVMLDDEGLPVWYHVDGEDPARLDFEVTLVDGDRVLFGGSVAPGATPLEVDLSSEVVWRGPQQPNSMDSTPPGAMHHTFRKLDDGTYLALVYAQDGGTNHWYDVVHQFDAGGETVWSWEAQQLPLGEPVIYPWGNAAVADLEQDLIYYNTRGYSALYCVDRATGELVWVLGEGGDFAGDPDHDVPWFTEAHAPEFQPDGNLLLHDNGDIDRAASRAVEYELDHEEMTARIVWEYPGEGIEDEWYSFHAGDADRMANGNTLITVGQMIPSGSQSRLFEVTPDREKVWEVWLSSTDEDKAAAGFSAERIPVLVGQL